MDADARTLVLDALNRAGRELVRTYADTTTPDPDPDELRAHAVLAALAGRLNSTPTSQPAPSEAVRGLARRLYNYRLLAVSCADCGRPGPFDFYGEHGRNHITACRICGASWPTDQRQARADADRERSEAVKRLQSRIDRYLLIYECGDHQYSPWKANDPDGGELRLVGCLREVLPHLSEDGIALAERNLGDTLATVAQGRGHGC